MPGDFPARAPGRASGAFGSIGGAANAVVKVGQSGAGPVVRVEGRGTMRQSPAVHEFICRLLGADTGSAVLDLTACTYLDSTFLGCLLDLHKRFGTGKPPRFSVALLPEAVGKLFGPTGLQKLLNLSPGCPPISGNWLPLATEARGAGEVARHVMECHRLLAEIEGPNRAVFARIAEQMGRDIERGEVRK